MKRLAAVLLLLLAPGAAWAGPAGMWLGLTGCERNRIPFRLDVGEDGGARLSGRFSPQALTGGVENGEARFSFSRHLAGKPPRRQAEFGLTGRLDPDTGRMVGEMEGVKDCPVFVAERIDLPPPAAEPGLIDKIAAARRAERVLTVDDCEAYFDWLDGGEVVLVVKGVRMNDALADQERMRQILGRDLYRWSEEDAAAAKKLKACVRVLNKTKDPARVALAKRVRKNGGVAPSPLSHDPVSRNGGGYIDAMRFIHAAEFRDLNRLLLLAASDPGAVVAGAPPPAGSAAAAVEAGRAEWVGVISCGRGERYLKMSETSDAFGEQVVAEIGPGLGGLSESGSLSMKGSIGEGGFELAPKAWINRDNSIVGRINPFGLKGESDPASGALRGAVVGLQGCESFRAYRLPTPDLAIRPDGLLFQPKTTKASCDALAGWLAKGEEDRIGGFGFNTLILEDAAIADLFGKAPATWSEQDRKRYVQTARECAGWYAQSADLDRAALYRSIPRWAISPLKDARDKWGRYELVRVLGAEAERRAADRVAAADALPAAFESLAAIDRLNAEAERGRGELAYLRRSRLAAHLAAMGDVRDRIGRRIADAALAGFEASPVTLAALNEAERTAGSTAGRLRKSGAPAAASALESDFVAFGARRAAALWDAFLVEAPGRLDALRGRGYEAFDEVAALRDRSEVLSHYLRPTGNPERGAAWKAYREASDATVEAMVTASLPGLLAWIEALPLSRAGLDAAGDLMARTFGGGARPSFPAAKRLREAIEAKAAAYNPEGYARPDFVHGLGRRLFGDVKFRGLDNLAYFSTSVKLLLETCPALPRPGDGELAAYALAASTDATQRLMSGQLTSRAEGERATWLFLNMLMNRPGCKVDFFGNVTNDCTTPEEQQAVTGFLMTSGDATSDMRKLLAKGCGGEDAAAFATGLAEFVGMAPFSRGVRVAPPPALSDFLGE